MSARTVRTVDMDDIGASLETCIACGSGDIVSQHVVTFRGREFAMTVASWCEKPECEEDRRLTVLSVGMLPPGCLAPAIDPDDEALVEKVAEAIAGAYDRRGRLKPGAYWAREHWRVSLRDDARAAIAAMGGAR